VYLHGGAWCVWTAAQVRRLTLPLAMRGYCVISVNYGLAPENPFPRAVEDAIYGVRWAVRNAERFRGDPTFLAIGGDSSGANLTAASIAFLHGHRAELDEGDLADAEVTPAAALLLCGVFDFPQRMHERNTTPGTTEIMSNLAYLGPHFLSKHYDPLVSPVYAANLDRFPPTYLCCGDEDATLPQTLRMTAALADAGVSTTLSVVSGFDHEFLLTPGHVPAVEQERERLLAWLDERRRAPVTTHLWRDLHAASSEQSNIATELWRRG
jgi:acetyl esterase